MAYIIGIHQVVIISLNKKEWHFRKKWVKDPRHPELTFALKGENKCYLPPIVARVHYATLHSLRYTSTMLWDGICYAMLHIYIKKKKKHP